MEIQLHGEYTEQDLRRGLALMRGRAFQFVGIGIVIIIVMGAVPTIISILSGEAEALDVLSFMIPTVLVLAFIGFLLWRVPLGQVRALKKAPLFQGTISGVVTDKALELRSEQSEGKTKWGAFVRYKMSDEIVLLYQNKAAAQIISRGLFASDEDWDQFQQFVQATVPQKTKTQGGRAIWRWAIYIFLALVVALVLLSGIFDSL